MTRTTTTRRVTSARASITPHSPRARAHHPPTTAPRARASTMRPARAASVRIDAFGASTRRKRAAHADSPRIDRSRLSTVIARARVDVDRDYDVHTVMYGDTLVGVARARGTSVEALCAVNGIRFGDGAEDDAPALFVGQRLLIPPSDVEAWEMERVSAGARRGARAMSERERDAEFERARRARSERKKLSTPATKTHVGLSGNAVEELTRDEVAALLAHREETVMLLVETSNCSWCEDAQPAWTALAVCYANDPSVRVCRLRCDTDDAKQFAAKYFRANTFPTIVALPAGSGPVYRHASTDRSVATLLEFADEATGRASAALAIDVRAGKESYATTVTGRAMQGSAPAQVTRFAPPRRESPFRSLTAAVGKALGIENGSSANVGVRAQSASRSEASVNVVTFAAGGLAAMAVLAALANVALVFRSVAGGSDGSRTRRVARHFNEERIADDSEPMDDYEEAVLDVSNQDDIEVLAEWRSLVVDELISLPARALLLIRIWFLIGKQKFALRMRGGRRRGGSRRSREDYYEEDGEFEVRRSASRRDREEREARRPSRDARDDDYGY